ncbi:site-specific integrase [Methylophilus sp. 13]|uniref:site-specific integrase n=1 Tax=Methylophilus sp. 13 TaxID=2781018 RepID=UPI00188E3ABE|nr:site-specific integrase [Methylophilus sp. 13]MBF5037959.1 site-specific integrase [Methylophilus sp. 13]
MEPNLEDFPKGSKISRTGSRVRVVTPKQQEQIRLNSKRRRVTDIEGYVSPEVQFILNLAIENTQESLVQYVSLYQGSRTGKLRPEGWLQNPTNYIGREHIDIQKLGEIWFPTMCSWLHYRKVVQGFETDSEPRAALHILSDYLFLYLPWWLELNSDSDVILPFAPKDFLRTVFVDKDEEIKQNPLSVKKPITLIDLIALRRESIDGINNVVRTLETFFAYVITKFESHDNVVGSAMVNPFRLLFDLRKSKARSKTNKPAFSENVFAHMVLYSQGVEAFGEYLMYIGYERNAFRDKPYGEKYGFDTAAYGFMPIIFFRGKVYPLKWIPNLYPFAQRTIATHPAGKAGIYVNGSKINRGKNGVRFLHLPVLSIHRIIMCMLETGLRGQSVQWLDRNTWDSVNTVKTPIDKLYTNEPPEKYTDLLVNTDKTKDKPWTTLISWRNRRSILAEQYFQESLEELDKDTLCNYESRDNSRFDPILPLFRSCNSVGPCSDSAYSKRWLEFLYGFQTYYNSLNPNNNFLKLIHLSPQTPGFGSLNGHISKDKNFSKIKTSTPFTPHSCRSTYATLKDGDFEVSEICAQIGHASTVVTNYYQVPSQESIRSKLEKFEKKLDISKPLGAGDVYIHPEERSSALRKAFNGSKEATLNNFGFIPGISFWSSDQSQDNDDALDLLIDSPASSLKWHSTHVCPVGNQCPSDIVQKIGGNQRCGLCNLAAKCVDHLPGIAAKKNELVERIQSITKRINTLKDLQTQESINIVERLYREQELDAREYTGWTLSEDILSHKLEDLKKLDSNGNLYHVDSPEIVKKHLKLVSRKSNANEFLLQRISDSNAYPTLETSEIRAKSSMLVRKLLAMNNQKELALELEIDPGDEIKVFMSLIKPFAEAHNLGFEDISKLLQSSRAQNLAKTRPKLISNHLMDKR